MINGKCYLIIKKQENGCYPIKLAYWFDERVTNRHIYPDDATDSNYFCTHSAFSHLEYCLQMNH